MRILTIVLSLIFAFVCVEFVLRLTDYSRVHLSRWDFDAGVRHLESSSGYYVKESKKKIIINDQGIRVAKNQKDFKFSENKSKNTYRISVFGDSYTEGLQVEFEERFSFIMERELNLCKYKPKENIEIINFGISGSGQSRQFEMQQGWAKKYESDIILVVTHSNDPRNNYSKLEPGIYYPYWTLENGKIKRDNSFRENAVFLKKIKYSNLRMKIVNEVRTLQLITQAFEVYLKNQNIKKTKKHYEDLYGSYIFYYNTPDWIDAWNIYLTGFQFWQETLVKDNIPLYVSSTHIIDHFIPDEYWRKNFNHDEKNFDELMIYESQTKGFNYLPVSNFMGKRAEELGVDFHYHDYTKQTRGHYNNIAHFEWGKKMAFELCEKWRMGKK